MDTKVKYTYDDVANITYPAMLRQLAETDLNPFVRYAAGVRLDDPEVLKRIALTDPDPDVRSAARTRLRMCIPPGYFMGQTMVATINKGRTSEKDKPIPEAMYPCSQHSCKESTCYAQQLHWYEEESRWVCDACWPSLPPIRPKKAVSLENYLVSLNKEGKR